MDPLEDPNVYKQWVIYKHPRDCPGCWVVRPFCLVAGAIQPHPRSTHHRTLHEARAALPSGLANIGRFPEDDPVIHEVWT